MDLQAILSKMSSGGGFSVPKTPKAYGNWQTYAGMNPNAEGVAGSVANPAQFGSFQQYAGMGVAPPAQASPAPSVAQVGQRIGDTFDQLKQGNILDAFKTYQSGVKPVAPVVATAPTAPQMPQADDKMSFEFGD